LHGLLLLLHLKLDRLDAVLAVADLVAQVEHANLECAHLGWRKVDPRVVELPVAELEVILVGADILMQLANRYLLQRLGRRAEGRSICKVARVQSGRCRGRRGATAADGRRVLLLLLLLLTGAVHAGGCLPRHGNGVLRASGDKGRLSWRLVDVRLLLLLLLLLLLVRRSRRRRHELLVLMLLGLLLLLGLLVLLNLLLLDLLHLLLDLLLHLLLLLMLLVLMLRLLLLMASAGR
jgi:hypothetical protein